MSDTLCPCGDYDDEIASLRQTIENLERSEHWFKSEAERMAREWEQQAARIRRLEELLREARHDPHYNHVVGWAERVDAVLSGARPEGGE